MTRYSFIIPVKAVNDYIRESIPKILSMPRKDFEILIYPDAPSQDTWPRTRQIPTGHEGPAAKRSRAIQDAEGSILVFIDDDAYPAEDFLQRLDDDFTDPAIKAVGGPALTPKDDSLMQKVSGAVYLSRLSGGNPERYVPYGEKHYVEDWPSVNFSVRTEVFRELHGFNSSYWPGEDTLFCMDLAGKYANSILYDPELIVYHHRRGGLLRHLKQAAGYGLHRGYFAKKFPSTSRKAKYFLPLAFVLFITAGCILSLLDKRAALAYATGWGIYLLALIKALVDIRRHEKNLLVLFHALYYIPLTHIAYGLAFFKGFFATKNLYSRLR